MFIQTEATPNPATLKFLPGKPVLESGTLDLRSREDAAKSPLAERLFAIDGVDGVFFGSDFITVSKSTGEWPQLKPAILGAIMEHFMSGAPLLRDGENAAGADSRLSGVSGFGFPRGSAVGRRLRAACFRPGVHCSSRSMPLWTHAGRPGKAGHGRSEEKECIEEPGAMFQHEVHSLRVRLPVEIDFNVGPGMAGIEQIDWTDALKAKPAFR